MDQSPAEPYALSPRNAAARLSISPEALYQHCYSAMLRGDIETYWIGTAVRIVWPSLQTYTRQAPHSGQAPTIPYAVSPRAAARLLGIHPATYYKHIHPAVLRGEIETHLIGTSVRLVWSSLLDYIRAESRRKVQARMSER